MSTGHEPELVAAVVGFVCCFETKTFQCVESFLDDGTYMSTPVRYLRRVLATRNGTEISHGVSVISHFSNCNEGAKENFAEGMDHGGAGFNALKAYLNPKNLIFHVMTEFVHDGYNIFAIIVFAGYEWLQGDHFSAGGNLEIAPFRSLVGEFNGQPLAITEGQLIFAGFLVGFLSGDGQLVQWCFDMSSGFNVCVMPCHQVLGRPAAGLEAGRGVTVGDVLVLIINEVGHRRRKQEVDDGAPSRRARFEGQTAVLDIKSGVLVNVHIAIVAVFVHCLRLHCEEQQLVSVQCGSPVLLTQALHLLGETSWDEPRAPSG